MGPNLREAAQGVEHKEEVRIRGAKREEMRKSWDDLFFILAGEDVFKKSPEFRNYASFEESLRQTLEEVGDHQPLKAAKPETTIGTALVMCWLSGAQWPALTTPHQRTQKSWRWTSSACRNIITAMFFPQPWR